MSDELNKVVEAVKGVPGKVQEMLDKTDIDEKVVDAVKGLPGKVQEMLDKTDIDEKIVDGAKNLAGKISGLFKGNTDGTFAPTASLTRAQAVMLFYRIAGSPAAEGELTFTDVSETAYYADAVIWAKASGVVKGVNDTTFAPSDPITREQFAVMVSRLAETQEVTLEGENTAEFTDADQIAGYAQDGVDACVAAGIISGNSDGTFAPKASITREQAAKMLVIYQEIAG